jgi:hypothetical protein
MEPIVHGLETEFEADVVFEQLDVSTERGQAALKAHSLGGHPSYVLLDENGEVVWKFAGQTEKDRKKGEHQAEEQQRYLFESRHVDLS